VAYSHNDRRITAAPRTLKQIVNDINVITSWPNSGLFYKEKTPTVLAYNTFPPTWGHSVLPGDEPRITHFKLGFPLYDGDDSGLEGSFQEYGSDPDLPGLSAVDFTTDYLAALIKFVMQTVLQDKSLNISYILTVPAICRDLVLSRLAASRAFGIPQDHLLIVAEPEAAVHYCTRVCWEEDEFEEGNRILICDAGGRTVVFLTFE
jgi:hypothetical protein